MSELTPSASYKPSWFSNKPWQAQWKTWGYCSGDRYPSYYIKHKRFRLQTEALAWAHKHEEKEPPARLTAGERAIVDAIEMLLQKTLGDKR